MRLLGLLLVLMIASTASHAEDEDRLGINVRMQWNHVVMCNEANECLVQRRVHFVQVIGVDSGSDAESQGVRQSDFVDSINGTSMRGIPEEKLMECLQEMESRDVVKLKLARVIEGELTLVDVQVKLKPKPLEEEMTGPEIRS